MRRMVMSNYCWWHPGVELVGPAHGKHGMYCPECQYEATAPEPAHEAKPLAYPEGEPILIPGKRYAYTTKAIPNHNVRKRWYACRVIHHVPSIHRVWVKMEESGIHKVVSTTEMKFQLAD